MNFRESSCFGLLRAGITEHGACPVRGRATGSTVVRALTFVLLETGDRAAGTKNTGPVSPNGRSRHPLAAARPPSRPGAQPPRAGSLGHVASRAAVFRLLQTDDADRSPTVQRRHDFPERPSFLPAPVPLPKQGPITALRTDWQSKAVD